jgi:hypothetical protein
LVSKYVSLMVIAPSTPIMYSCFTIKWFFGYSMEE